MSEKIEVNVEQIMEEIRKKARMEADMQALPEFESIPFRNIPSEQQANEGKNWNKYVDCLGYLNRNCEIPYYWSFGSNGSLKVLIKRVVRKLAKCILFPILTKQNELNANYVRCLNQLRWVVEEQRAENEALREEVRQLRAAAEQQCPKKPIRRIKVKNTKKEARGKKNENRTTITNIIIR